MANYKDRVRQDLEKWIAQGLVPASNRDAILSSLPEARRIDAATALAWIGGLLLGVAAIAFVAANWDGIPRIARFALVLSGFATAAGFGAWASAQGRALTSNIALTVAALAFAGAIGLTGQIFDIIGDPRTALYFSGAAAFALALAGGSTGAACAALVLIGLGDLQAGGWFGDQSGAPWLVGIAPLGVALSLKWKSPPLAHVSAAGMLFAALWLVSHGGSAEEKSLVASFLLAAAAFAARHFGQRGLAYASVFFGWAVWGALAFFAGASPHGPSVLFGATIVHRILWLVLSAGVVALGRFDRHMLVTAIGVLSMIGAISVLLMDLGLDLMTAAGVFFLCAVGALVGGMLLRRSSKSMPETAP